MCIYGNKRNIILNFGTKQCLYKYRTILFFDRLIQGGGYVDFVPFLNVGF